MSAAAQALLKAFRRLPLEEQRLFTEEFLRRCLPFDSGPLTDEALGQASASLFRFLDEEDANATSR